MSHVIFLYKDVNVATARVLICIYGKLVKCSNGRTGILAAPGKEGEIAYFSLNRPFVGTGVSKY